MKLEILQGYVDTFWDNEVLPAISKYITIPNKSPVFDPEWRSNGYMDKAVELVEKWILKHKPEGSILHTYKDGERTPLLVLEIPGEKPGTVLMYGHLDKQPEMEGWADELGPWKPVLIDDKLYGRGGADDGYSIFASLSAVLGMADQGILLPKIIVIMECSEESGSPDLPFYMDRYEDIIGSPDLVICLDSGAGNYEQFWTTTSLRGLVGCSIKVEILKAGIHSGGGSGIVPSSFRILRQLLSRLEDEKTGQIIVKELQVDIPKYRIDEVKTMVHALGDEVFTLFPWIDGAFPVSDDKVEMVLNNTWRPMLSIVAADGLPPVRDGGNVLRPYTTLKLSLRIPPTLDAQSAQRIIHEILTNDPPYNSRITVEFEKQATGWEAPPFAAWLEDVIKNASVSVFEKPPLALGEGGTIPFMSMLGKKFPKAQYVITGVLGPQSNAHGPNEFLYIPYAKKLTTCIALILEKFSM